MTSDNWGWIDEQEKKNKEERNKDYFNIVEGDNKFVLLTHFAPFAQMYEGGKYRPATEGEKPDKVVGVCWVWQDGVVKLAKMPWTAVKAVRALKDNEDWEFTIPFKHVLTLNALGAGEKTVKYSLTSSPKTVDIPQDIQDELSKKPSPEEMVEKLKGAKVSQGNAELYKPDYPADELDPDDIPF